MSHENPRKILLISEDHHAIQEQFDRESYLTIEFMTTQQAINKIKLTKQFGIILLDISKNKQLGLELCSAIKSAARSRNNLLIMITDKYEYTSEVSAFKSGADDFIMKPVHPSALIQRIKTRLKDPKTEISFESEHEGNTSIHIDKNSYTVFVDNEALNLSRKEFELLYLLAEKPGKIFNRNEIFEKIWRKKMESTNRTVDVHILRLRKKIGHNWVHTQKGVGYRFIA